MKPMHATLLLAMRRVPVHETSLLKYPNKSYKAPFPSPRKAVARALDELCKEGLIAFSSVSDNRRWMIVPDGLRAIEKWLEDHK